MKASENVSQYLSKTSDIKNNNMKYGHLLHAMHMVKYFRRYIKCGINCGNYSNNDISCMYTVYTCILVVCTQCIHVY